jgi:hypothetical protein
MRIQYDTFIPDDRHRLAGSHQESLPIKIDKVGYSVWIQISVVYLPSPIPIGVNSVYSNHITRTETTRMGPRPILSWSLETVILTCPYIGAAVIGKVLIHAGFRCGNHRQLNIHSPQDITRLGEPALFWGVTAGCIDSMVANYTPPKPRANRMITPQVAFNNRRPNRATIV